jgi:hypothetical protein
MKKSDLGTSNESLLTEIRDNFQYAVSSWRKIREQGSIDMRYVSGDPWDAGEKAARKEAGRPCIALDELNQYTNQLINTVRQNKRAVKVIPEGNGATDESAEWRGNVIRQIEYKSNAQAAYCGAFEDATHRSYGFARVSKRWITGKSVQELFIRRIANPDTVYIDPDFKEPDASDMEWAFIIENFRREKFRRRWPKAELKDFSPEMISENPLWLKEDSIQVAEYWRVDTSARTVIQVDRGAGPVDVYADDIPPEDLETLNILHSHEEQGRKVTQYITNGVEILEVNEWDGDTIPLGLMRGKEIYVDEGSGSERKWLSLVRLARDPYMLYCYYRTCELELAGMVPKTPVIGYEGQFEGHEDEWQKVGKAPIAFLQAKPVLDATGQHVLPLPQWQHWDPPIQSLEMGAEAARRAIQAAMGISPLPTAAQRNNEKSGVALERIQTEQAVGTFHFVDQYELFLERMGRILNGLLASTYDTARDVGARTAGEEHQVIRLNDPNFVDPKTKQPTHYDTSKGDHDVTISTGPSSQSQHDEASEFADNLAQNEAIFPRIADLVIKLKNLGPIGDEIAKRLMPPDVAAQQQGNAAAVPPAVQQQMEQGKQTMLQQAQIIHKLQDQIDQKAVEMASRERIAAMSEETKRQGIQADIRIAELNAGLKSAIARLEQEVGVIKHSIEIDDAQQARDQAAAQAAADAQAQPPAQTQPQQ